MIKGELQTEDGFQIVTAKQEPSLMNVKTEPEVDTESYVPFQQNIKSEIETYRELGGKSEPNFNTDVKKEPEDDNPDSIVCNERLTANQKFGSGSESQSTSTVDNYIRHENLDVIGLRKTDKHTTINSSDLQSTDTSSTVRIRRNCSRSAKRNILYHEDNCETDLKEYNSLNGVADQCWKFSETYPSEIETELWRMDQSDSEPVLASDDRESGVLEILSVKEKRFKCDICDKKFTQNSSLTLHIRTVHDKVKPFKCPHCPHKAGERGTLKQHIFTHTGETNFKCDICDKKYTLKSHLNRHIRRVHDKVKAFECPYCPYKAAYSGNLKRHILTHTGKKNFKCDICENTFTQCSSLTLHIRTVHDKVKAFECPHCPFKAGRNGDLKQHILTHTGEKNFKCDICEKSFTSKGSLKLHIRTVHDKIKAFECPHCPYKAGERGNLKHHILTHTGEKTFKCNICDKKFTLSNYLNRHIKNVHNVSEFS